MHNPYSDKIPIATSGHGDKYYN